MDIGQKVRFSITRVPAQIIRSEPGNRCTISSANKTEPPFKICSMPPSLPNKPRIKMLWAIQTAATQLRRS